MRLLTALFATAKVAAPLSAEALVTCDIIPFLSVAVGSKNSEECRRLTGFEFLGTPSFDDLLSDMCAATVCVDLFTQVDALFPTECEVLGYPLRETYIDKFVTGCKTAPPPSGEPSYCNWLLFNAIGASTREGMDCTKQTGFSFVPTDFHVPNATEFQSLCKNPNCLTTIADLNSEFSSECLLFDILLRESFLDKFPAVCAVTTTPPTTAPTTPTPTPTPAPTTATPPVLNGPCGSDQVGAKACIGGQYCQPWNPTEYQCRSISATCGVQETGFDYNGDDLATLQLTLPEDCCAKCASTSGCTGYTFVNYNPDGKAYCYLKKGPGTKVAKIGAVSATIVRSPSPAPTPTTATPEPTTTTPPILNGPCGNQQVGAKTCAGGQYCQPWSPSEYQCRSIAATCGVQETGIDYSGDDLATVQLTLPEDCCSRCSTTIGCTGYTFVNYNADGKAYCYLKKGPGVRTSVVGAVSGTITPAKCTRQYPGVDFYGSDLTAVYGVTTTACCERCATTSGCKAYTYVGSSSSCYLKSAASDQRTGAGVVSALLN